MRVINQIEILGSGCSKCSALEKTTEKAIKELNISADLTKVNEIDKILEFGILRTPGLVINGKVILSGENPGLDKIKQLLKENIIS